MSRVFIAKISDASRDLWDLAWRSCSYTSYFHSREWAEIWQEYTAGQVVPAAKLVTFSDKTRTVLPLSRCKSPFALFRFKKSYISSPAGTYGGWISQDPLTSMHAQALVNYISSSLGNVTWRLNPFDQTLSECSFRNFQNDETHVISLSGGFDAVREAWNRSKNSTPRKARKARDSGILIKTAQTIDDWRHYYSVYQDSLRRWGETASSVYDWTLFDIIFRRYSTHVKLWLALLGETITAGALCFYAGKHAVYWHGAALENYFALRPVNLLMYEVVRHACENHYQWLDLNPSGGHQGVKRFKESLGAQTLNAPIIYAKDRISRVASSISKGSHFLRDFFRKFS